MVCAHVHVRKRRWKIFLLAQKVGRKVLRSKSGAWYWTNKNKHKKMKVPPANSPCWWGLKAKLKSITEPNTFIEIILHLKNTKVKL